MLEAVIEDDIDEMEQFLQDCINNDMTDTNCFTNPANTLVALKSQISLTIENTAKSLCSMIIFHACTT